MLQVKNLYKIFGDHRVVNDISLEIKKGEIVGLLGPNGAGKTTTFYMIIGLIRPSSGNVALEGMDITDLPMYKRSRHGVGYLPQEVSIFRKMTVRENILAVWEMHSEIDKRHYENKLTDLLTEMKINHLQDRLGYELSGGEKRRVEIARALALNPKFLLLDEPFAGIDPIAVHDIQGIIKYLKERGIGILITDHNVRETLSITDHAYIIDKGAILLAGDSTKIINDPKARKIYLGEGFSL